MFVEHNKEREVHLLRKWQKAFASRSSRSSEGFFECEIGRYERKLMKFKMNLTEDPVVLSAGSVELQLYADTPVGSQIHSQKP